MNLHKILKIIDTNNYNQRVYRFIDYNNDIIYVGKTNDMFQRMRSHSNLGDDNIYYSIERIEYVAFDNYEMLSRAEFYFIAKYKPKYNKIGKHSYFMENINLDNLNWKLYGYYPRESIINEMESLYNLVSNGIHIDFNLSKLWLMLNYSIIVLDNCANIRLWTSKLSKSIIDEVGDTMYGIYNELSFKVKKSINIIYSHKFRSNYIEVTDIRISDYPSNIQIFLKNKYLILYIEVKDIYGFELEWIPIIVKINDVK